MNWISEVVRPKIKTLFKREAPDNLWIKCPDTGQVVFHKDVEANQWVIPGSNHHMRISATQRLGLMFDGGTWLDVALPEVAVDPLKFRDEKRYIDRLKDARAKTGQQDAFKVGFGRVEDIPMTIAVQDFGFMGGSLGMAAGEAFIKGAETAIEKKTPYILFAASGGARMQEGILSLMQMPRTTVGDAPPARGEAALHRGAHQPDHRRRHRLLRDAGRRPYRRARRADRLRGPAGDRADDPREAARRLPARRVSEGSRHGRHGGAPPRPEGDRRAPRRPVHEGPPRSPPDFSLSLPHERPAVGPYGSCKGGPHGFLRRADRALSRAASEDDRPVARPHPAAARRSSAIRSGACRR